MALLEMGPVSGRRVYHTPYYPRGMKVTEATSLLGAGDFANFTLQCAGWLPNQRGAARGVSLGWTLGACLPNLHHFRRAATKI